MKKILLVCSAGMSTSLLVTNMNKYAKTKNYEVEIHAVAAMDAESVWQEYDIMMLGPQVRPLIGRFEKMVNGKIPLEIINMKDYGMMNGEKVLNTALEILDKK